MNRSVHLRFFMTSSSLHSRGPRPLTSPGLVHILATFRSPPCNPPSPWGWPFPTPFRPLAATNQQNGTFASESSVFPPLKYTLDMCGQLDILWPKTRSSLHNPKQSRRNSCVVPALSTRTGFPPSVYLLRRPHRISIAPATTT